MRKALLKPSEIGFEGRMDLDPAGNILARTGRKDFFHRLARAITPLTRARLNEMHCTLHPSLVWEEPSQELLYIGADGQTYRVRLLPTTLPAS